MQFTIDDEQWFGKKVVCDQVSFTIAPIKKDDKNEMEKAVQIYTALSIIYAVP